MGLMNALRGRRVYLDTNVFVYALEGFSPYRAELTRLFSGIDEGVLFAVTSQLTLAELLVKPFQQNDTAKEAVCRRAIQNRQGLLVVPVELEILIGAAKLRAKYKWRMPDAIHAATAMAAACDVFLTNDTQLADFEGLKVFQISNLIEA